MANDDLELRVGWLVQAVQELSSYSNPPLTLPPKAGSSLAEAKAAVDSLAG